jgi:hypothetical protein
MTAENAQTQAELAADAPPGHAPYAESLQVALPLATAAKASFEAILGVVPFAGVVTGISYVPEVEEAESETEFRTFEVVNLGAAGAGATVLGEFSTKAAKAKAGVAQPLALAAAANLGVAAGDILKFKDTSTEGKATSHGLIVVTIARVVATGSPPVLGYANENDGNNLVSAQEQGYLS